MLGMARMKGRTELHFFYVVSILLFWSTYFVDLTLFAWFGFLIGQALIFFGVKRFCSTYPVVYMKETQRLWVIRPDDPKGAQRLFSLKLFSWAALMFCYPGGLIEGNVVVFFFSSMCLAYILGECCLQAMVQGLRVEAGSAR